MNERHQPRPRLALIVDPHDGVCSVLRRMLREQLIDTVVASGQEEALMLVKSHGDQIDVLVTELDSPNSSGIELIVHALRHRPRLAVVCLSSAPANDAHLRLVPACAAIVPKPFTVSQLTSAIERSLSVNGASAGSSLSRAAATLLPESSARREARQ